MLLEHSAYCCSVQLCKAPASASVSTALTTLTHVLFDRNYNHHRYLCMQTLFTLKEQGGVRLQKFLSFSPAAVCKYIMSASDPTLQGRTVDQVSEHYCFLLPKPY
jgi:hypothetical protein